MKAIILSAGQGRRLLPLTATLPKCALAVAGQSVLEWQLQSLRQCAIDEIVIVTGFGADAVDAIVAHAAGIRVRTVYNPFFAQSDNLGSCWIARHEMDDPFMIINGDTLFEATIPQRLIGALGVTPITLVTDTTRAQYDDDDMKVIVAVDGRLRRVSKRLDKATVNGESIGMMAFTGEGPALFRARLDYLMRYGEGTRQWYLSAIDDIAAQGHVGSCPISGLSWCEIDDQNDLRRATTVVESWRMRAPITTATV